MKELEEALLLFLEEIIKGVGGDSVNETRRIAREAISEGTSPTLRAANESPILGRLQAIYEGVYPNEATQKQMQDLCLKIFQEKLKKQGSQENLLNQKNFFNY